MAVRRRRKTRLDLDSAIRAAFDDLSLRVEQACGRLPDGQSPSQHEATREAGAHLGSRSALVLHRLLRKKRRRVVRFGGQVRVRVEAETRLERDIRQSRTPGDFVRRQIGR